MLDIVLGLQGWTRTKIPQTFYCLTRTQYTAKHWSGELQRHFYSIYTVQGPKSSIVSRTEVFSSCAACCVISEDSSVLHFARFFCISVLTFNQIIIPNILVLSIPMTFSWQKLCPVIIINIWLLLKHWYWKRMAAGLLFHNLQYCQSVCALKTHILMFNFGPINPQHKWESTTPPLHPQGTPTSTPALWFSSGRGGRAWPHEAFFPLSHLILFKKCRRIVSLSYLNRFYFV